MSTGTQKDETRAYQQFEEAARQGNPLAYYYVASCLKQGEGAPQDLSKATVLFAKAYNDVEKAAKQGDWLGEFLLGACYDFGNGCERNQALAPDWYHRSALKGHWYEILVSLSVCEREREITPTLKRLIGY